jgi:hypothetical protein
MSALYASKPLLLPPQGIIRPNRDAIANGLSFAQAFQNGDGLTWLSRGAMAPGLGYANGAHTRVSRGGPGMMGANAQWGGRNAGFTYTAPTAAGTALVFTVADFSPTDGQSRMLFHFGPYSYPTGPVISMQKAGDNKVYFGWYAGSDTRANVSASGLWAAGDLMTMATTWQTGSTRAYVKGKRVATNAGMASGSTAGADFTIGYFSEVNTWHWNSGTTGAILYVLLFDKAFSDSELAQAEADPWWWTEQPQRRRAASVSSTNDLTADDLTTGAPVLGTPALGQAHALTATGIVAGAPTLGTPAIGQAHALAATGIAAGAPTLGAPALGQGHALAADGLAAGAPVLGSPAVGQVHALAAPALAAGAPVLGSPTLAQVHALVAGGITTGGPVLGSPALNAPVADVPASRTIRLPARNRTRTLAARDRAVVLPARNRTIVLPGDRT